MMQGGGLLWLDNVNKFRYARNVNEERDRFINGAVMSVLPLANLRGELFAGWPPLSQLMRSLTGFPRYIVRAQRKLANEVKTLLQPPYSLIKFECLVTFAGPAFAILVGFLGQFMLRMWGQLLGW